MIKSAIIFQLRSQLTFVIVADFGIQSDLHFRVSIATRLLQFCTIFFYDLIYLQLQRLQSQAANRFSYELHNLSFPLDREEEWRSLFKPCATQRLFLPVSFMLKTSSHNTIHTFILFANHFQDILTNHTNILYVDTDVIFLNELSDVWQHVQQMNASQIAALVPEHEDPNVGWYSRFARHPFYGKLGSVYQDSYME